MSSRTRAIIVILGALPFLGCVVIFASPPKSIRDIDLKSYIIHRDNLVEFCKGLIDDSLESPIHFWEVEYADLDGDGAEEAVVEAATCAMGTGGCDIVEVLKLLPTGELRSLKITHEGYQEPKEYEGVRSTPRLDVKDGHLISWYVINATDPDKPKSGWTKTLIFKWKHDRFVVDKVVETPPIAPGNQ